MRRWNGWGDDTVQYQLTPQARTFISDVLGHGSPSQDAQITGVLEKVPPSRLPSNPMVSDDPLERLRHARGHSLPDWIALRSGNINYFPDAVAYPTSDVELFDLIQYAIRESACLIPYGGGTSVVGHINPPGGDAPAVTVNMRRMNRLLEIDEQDRLATFRAGVSGPELEAQLRARNLTLGHYPQSFEFSTLGGWIATRSKGQQALLYGRIEDLFAGGTLISPAGKLILLPHPASAAGPDLRQLVLGSEGRMGFITEATIRVSPLPEAEEFHGLFFPDFAAGQAAVREMVQSQLPLSMLRLSTPTETRTTLMLAGHERIIKILEQFLNVRGITHDKSLLIAGISGTGHVVKATKKEAWDVARRHGGIRVGKQFGKQWRNSRFRTPYLRNSLWDMGYAVDTLETAVPWRHIDETLNNIESALRTALGPYGERVHAFSHLSHLYSSGASIYVTYLYRRAEDSEETLDRWRILKRAASEVIVASKGTISHQHGVGTDHAPYLEAEKGPIGMGLIEDAIRRLDPRGVMNPSKLIETV